MKYLRSDIAKKTIPGYILFFCIVLVLLFMFSGEFENKSIRIDIVVTFIIIGVLSLFLILFDKYKFSINKTLGHFSFIFFFVAPLMQYLSQYRLWGYTLNEENMLDGNLLLIFFLIIYIFSWNCSSVNKSKPNKEIGDVSDKFLILITMCCCFIGIGIIGFTNLFYRESNVIGDANPITTILDKFIRFTPVYALTIYVLKYNFKLKVQQILVLAIIGVCVVVLNFPTALTRYYIGVVYIGLLLHFFKNKMSYRIFDYGMLLLFIVIFPLFQIFKWYTFEDFFTGNFYFRGFSQVYNNVDFDAYSMFIRILDYVDKYSVTYGKQLLSVVFFIIPRAIWKNKPFPTGQLVSEAQGASYTNLSAPYIGEGYVNFGIIGIVVFAILFAKIAKKLDAWYWKDSNGELTLINICYPYCIGLTIFLLRGALQPVVVYMFAIFLPIILCYLVYSKTTKVANDIELKMREMD